MDRLADHLGSRAFATRFEHLQQLLREVWWERFHHARV